MKSKWFVIAVLALSQFVMILDSTVMNVSISTVAKDLGTTISGMQAAITFYALTMAALMLTGGKLGDKWGRHNAFRIGSMVYGVGSLLTALSPNLPFLLFGWSLVEGLGAVLVIPAIAALAAINYTGKDRIVAFSILGAVTGLSAAVGPIIGGFVTTYLSWRYVFAAETIVMVGVLLVANKIHDEKTTKKVSIAGIVVLWLFIQRQKKLEAAGKDALLKASLLRLPVLRSGLATFMSQYFTIAALFFVVPVYLQTILGYDALKTGIKLIPLSIGLIIFSAIGSRASVVRSSKNISRWGQLAMSVGVLFVMGSIEPELRGGFFWVGMLIIGAGFGLLASQLGNVNMSAVGKKDTAEVGGLQGTFQNLGTSFGTAIAGSVFMLMLTSGFVSAVQSSPDLSASAKEKITSKSEKGVQIVSQKQAEQYVISAGGSKSTAQTVSQIYQDSQIKSLKEALFVVFAVGIISILFSRNLPATVTAQKNS
jgi:MFS family permease